jgi:hypothetical protein
MSAAGRDLEVQWLTTEGCCSYEKTWSATFHWDGTKLVTQHLTQTSGPVGAPLGDPSNHIDAHGLGAVRIGMTTAQINGFSDSALEFRPAGGGFCDAFTADGIQMLLPGNPTHRLEWIQVRSGGVYSDVSTVKGIRIGSTEAEVRAAYPGGVTGNSQQMAPYYAVFSGSDVLAFGIEGGKVTQLVAATKQALTTDELCA